MYKRQKKSLLDPSGDFFYIKSKLRLAEILEVLFSSLNSNMQQKVRVTFEIFHGLMVGSKLGIEKIFINFTAIIYFI